MSGIMLLMPRYASLAVVEIYNTWLPALSYILFYLIYCLRNTTSSIPYLTTLPHVCNSLPSPQTVSSPLHHPQLLILSSHTTIFIFFLLSLHLPSPLSNKKKYAVTESISGFIFPRSRCRGENVERLPSALFLFTIFKVFRLQDVPRRQARRHAGSRLSLVTMEGMREIRDGQRGGGRGRKEWGWGGEG